MTESTVQIHLSAEEAVAYQALESELRGYVAGVHSGAQAMAEHVKRLTINTLLANRKKQENGGGNGGN